MDWSGRRLRCRVFSSSMTGLLAWGLTVWWLVSAMGRTAGFLECCWGKCRGFAQLREGSDDPPPPVRTGASAWADATPRPASIPSRMTAIARMRRRRETRCIKPNPFTRHQTESTPPVYQSSSCQRQPCITSHEPMAQASRLLDVHRFSSYHPARRQHTRAGAMRSNVGPPPPSLLLSVASLTSASTSRLLSVWKQIELTNKTKESEA